MSQKESSAIWSSVGRTSSRVSGVVPKVMAMPASPTAGKLWPVHTHLCSKPTVEHLHFLSPWAPPPNTWLFLPDAGHGSKMSSNSPSSRPEGALGGPVFATTVSSRLKLTVRQRKNQIRSIQSLNPIRTTQFIFGSCIISVQNMVSSLLLPHLDT